MERANEARTGRKREKTGRKKLSVDSNVPTVTGTVTVQSLRYCSVQLSARLIDICPRNGYSPLRAASDVALAAPAGDRHVRPARPDSRSSRRFGADARRSARPVGAPPHRGARVPP